MKPMGTSRGRLGRFLFQFFAEPGGRGVVCGLLVFTALVGGGCGASVTEETTDEETADTEVVLETLTDFLPREFLKVTRGVPRPLSLVAICFSIVVFPGTGPSRGDCHQQRHAFADGEVTPKGSTGRSCAETAQAL